MTTPHVIRIYSRILDCGQQCSRLWHFLRSLDSGGSGRVSFNHLWMATQLGVSVRTVKRWIKQGLERGWFRWEKRISRDLTEIYLSSLKSVYENLGLDDVGAIAEVGIEHLGRSESKALATALEATYRQKQAYWAAKKCKRGQHKQLVLNPEKMATCETVPRVDSHIVVSAPFEIPGCSHAGLADVTGWSPSTIKRRLNNRWRCSRNLDTIYKRRVGMKLNDPRLLLEMQESGQSFMVTKNALGHSRVLKVLNDSGRSLIQLGCNIYSTGCELLSCRAMRRRLKKDASQLTSALV